MRCVTREAGLTLSQVSRDSNPNLCMLTLSRHLGFNPNFIFVFNPKSAIFRFLLSGHLGSGRFLLRLVNVFYREGLVFLRSEASNPPFCFFLTLLLILRSEASNPSPF